MRKRLVATLLVILVVTLAQVRARAQQVDCVGQYYDSVTTYYRELMQELNDIEGMSIFNPWRQVRLHGAAVMYYARAESAMFQLIQCAAIPKLGK